jgi:triacylglycerol lipase
MGKKLEMALAVLNGTIGDHLARTGNGLATELSFVHDGEPLPVDQETLARVLPDAKPRVAILLHGLMCSESVWDLPGGGDYGAFLSRDLGITPLYIRYNSGLSIPDNGERLCQLLSSLVEHYPVPITEIIPLGYSMGGLLVRSACHMAWLEKRSWLSLVRRAIYVGTPHLGAPMERAGRVLTKILRAIDDPYTRLISDIGDLRSDGLKDLGDADLRHEDRARRVASFSLRDPRHPVPLLPEIQHYLVAGSLSDEPWLAMWFGDAMVPVPSSTNGACADPGSLALPPDHVRLMKGFSHLRLAHDPDVYSVVRGWCEESP